jgi:hypothetical protein
MAEERILTLHPQGKAGVNIVKSKYDQVKDYILGILEKEGNISFEDLSDRSQDELQPHFDGKVLWYVVTVKLDLEARGVIERIPRTSPHEIRLTGKKSAV